MLAFGTYDKASHPRVQVLIDGLRAHGALVRELNAPLGLSTADRVRILKQPWRLPVLAWRLLSCWLRLARGAFAVRRGGRPDAVVVGYLGHFDVLLARVLFPRTTIVLDHLIFAANTAADRGVRQGIVTRLLHELDGVAIRAADIVVVDTEEHREMVPAERRETAIVVPVGATARWLEAGSAVDGFRDGVGVVFFGLFTPLQGTPFIGEAIRALRGSGLRVTLVGSGQDAAVVRAAVVDDPAVTWLDWVDGADLPTLVASHDICLGIFGTTSKAARVVPNKVYQGAAAGAAIVTSDTAPQRRVLGDAAVFVPPGDAAALAASIRRLAEDPDLLASYRRRARELAATAFTADAVTKSLAERLGLR